MNCLLIAILKQTMIYLFQNGRDDSRCLVTIGFLEIDLLRVAVQRSQALIFDGEAITNIREDVHESLKCRLD